MQKDLLSGASRLEELGMEHERLTEDSYKDADLEHWLREFYVLYGPNNKSRSIPDIWLGVMKNASYVAEATRKNNPGEILEGTAHVFSWLCSVIGRCRYEHNDLEIRSKWQFDRTIEEIIFTKYPRHCPLCLQEECHCPIKRIYYEEANSVARTKIWQDNKPKLKRFQETSVMPQTLTQWSDMFSYIYGEVNYSASLDSICFHFLEEIGEAAGAIFKVRRLSPEYVQESEKEGIYNELADIFSWLFGLFNKVNRMLVGVERFLVTYQVPSKENKETSMPPPISIDTILWKSYSRKGEKYLTCPHCGKNVCECGDAETKEL